MDRQRVINLLAAIAAITVFGFTLGLMFPLLSLIMESRGVPAQVIGANAAMQPLGIVLSIARPLIDDLAEEIGVRYGPTLIFTGAVLFLLFVCMNLSMHVSRLTERSEILAEELTLLREQIESAGR